MNELIENFEVLLLSDMENAVKKSGSISTDLRTQGNVLFKKKNHNKTIHRNILSLYTQSLAFAPCESEELALAYNNRAILLQHLKQYERCLLDIDRALEVTNSIRLRAKLLCRKAECLLFFENGHLYLEDIVEEAKRCIDVMKSGNEDLKIKLAKIWDRETQEEDYDSNEQITLELPDLLISEEIPSASRIVELKHDDKFGRHLIVNQDVPTGKFLLIEKCYAVRPKIDQTYIACSECSDATFSGIPCDSCPCVVYCSEDCKELAWSRYHRLECSILPLISKKPFFSNTVAMALRIFTTGLIEKGLENGFEYVLNENKKVEKSTDKRTKGFSDGRFRSDKFSALCSLESCYDEVKQDVGMLLEWEAANVLKYFVPLLKKELGIEVADPQKNKLLVDRVVELKKLLMKITSIIKINGYLYEGSQCSCDKTDDEFNHKELCLNDLGIAVAPCSSLINHSCVPNVIRIYKNGQIILLSTKPIKQGEQLLCSYGPKISMDRINRQSYLQENYYFKCNCEPCSKSWPPPPATMEFKNGLSLFAQWSRQQSLLSHQIDKPIAEWQTFHELIPDLCEIIDDMHYKNTLFKAEMQSHTYKTLLCFTFTYFYGNGLDLVSKC